MAFSWQVGIILSLTQVEYFDSPYVQLFLIKAIYYCVCTVFNVQQVQIEMLKWNIQESQKTCLILSLSVKGDL